MLVLDYIADLTGRKGMAWSQEAQKVQLETDSQYVLILISQSVTYVKAAKDPHTG